MTTTTHTEELSTESKELDPNFKLLAEALQTLRWARVFVTTREKAKHPEGTDLYDETIKRIEKRLGGIVNV